MAASAARLRARPRRMTTGAVAAALTTRPATTTAVKSGGTDDGTGPPLSFGHPHGAGRRYGLSAPASQDLSCVRGLVCQTRVRKTERMARDLVVIGAPTSAGSYATGTGTGAAGAARERIGGAAERDRADVVRDAGDGPVQVWSPDRAAPRCAECRHPAALAIRSVAAQVGAALDDDADVLVRGRQLHDRDSASWRADPAIRPDAGLLYVDRHYDLNTPATTTDGALDWMGIAHGLGLPGTVPELTVGPRICCRCCRSTRLSYLGVDPAAATAGERSVGGRTSAWRGSRVAELASDPAEATRRALGRLRRGTVAVHVDVDVLDFTDAPLSESTGGRNSGPTLDALTDALAVACADARFRVLSIGELNPARSAGEPETIDRFIAALETAMG